MKVPTVCIVGRPNVGKSSLFNRIIDRRFSVVDRGAGTTRDRVEKIIELRDRPVMFVDTGGFIRSGNDRIVSLIREQIAKAVAYSDMILFVCDCIEGVTAGDMELVPSLRKSSKKVMLVVNKADNPRREEEAVDFYRLGLGDPFVVSSAHNIGIDSLKESVSDYLGKAFGGPSGPVSRPIKLAIVGRPNVGKSSLVNKLLNEERVMVDERPGTTRDSIDTYFSEGGTDFMLIDTAGIRHERKVRQPVDAYSMMRSREAIQRADIAALLIDGMEGATRDDAMIMALVSGRQKGCVICVNKWDLVKGITMERYAAAVIKKMPEACKVPIVFISAKTGRGVLGVIENARIVKTNMDLSLEQEYLEDMLTEIRPELLPLPSKAKRPRFQGIKMDKLIPKTFCVFVNDTKAVSRVHTNFIENNLRARFPLAGVPIRIIYKKRKKGRRS